jgi:hypothetical protein
MAMACHALQIPALVWPAKSLLGGRVSHRGCRGTVPAAGREGGRPEVAAPLGGTEAPPPAE